MFLIRFLILFLYLPLEYQGIFLYSFALIGYLWTIYYVFSRNCINLFFVSFQVSVNFDCEDDSCLWIEYYDALFQISKLKIDIFKKNCF